MKPFALLCSVFFLFCAISTLHPQNLKESRPNIIFILTDDQGYGDLSCTGNPIIKTPNMDFLHNNGARFNDFYVSSTCSPTRCALLTGRHEFESGITHTIYERERMALSSTTLPQVLKSAGYSTGIFGKWHLGDEEPYQPQNRGFDEVFIHGGGGIGQTYDGSCGDVPNNHYYQPTILHNGTFVKTKKFCTDVFFDQSITWIKSLPKNKPFFCFLPTNAAHTPLETMPEDETRYAGKVPPDVAKFYGMISNIDDNIGRLVKELETMGLNKNTLIILMNDNGGFGPAVKIYNAGMRGTKATPYLGGSRAISFWYWPDHIQPHDVSVLTAHLDLFPTLAELTGASISPDLQSKLEGQSLIPLLQDANSTWPERTLVNHIGRWGQNQDPFTHKFYGVGIRRSQWHLVSNSKDGTKPEWELYNVKKDIGETNNIISQNPEVALSLSTYYENWWKEVQPYLVNEKVVAVTRNPFKELFWKQFGGRPSDEEYSKLYPKKVIKE